LNNFLIIFEKMAKMDGEFTKIGRPLEVGSPRPIHERRHVTLVIDLEYE
jgi:hypothetical protein